MSNSENLKSLGSNTTDYPTTYSPEVLEAIPFDWSGQTVVELECPEFTSLCPKTHQPDFAQVRILYKPDKSLVESKSLKLYLFGFRNHGEFHEDCISRIARDLFELTKPFWIEVRGDFTPRGGISINPISRIEREPVGGLIIPR